MAHPIYGKRDHVRGPDRFQIFLIPRGGPGTLQLEGFIGGDPKLVLDVVGFAEGAQPPRMLAHPAPAASSPLRIARAASQSHPPERAVRMFLKTPSGTAG